jgi:hypothetical protein
MPYGCFTSFGFIENYDHDLTSRKPSYRFGALNLDRYNHYRRGGRLDPTLSSSRGSSPKNH